MNGDLVKSREGKRERGRGKREERREERNTRRRDRKREPTGKRREIDSISRHLVKRIKRQMQ